MSQSGVTSHDGRLGRFGQARHTLTPHLAAMKSLSLALEEAATGGLDEEIDRTALLNDLRVTQARFQKQRPQTRNPEFWLSHLLNGLHTLLARRDRTEAQRARALTERLEEVPAFLDDARATLTDPVRVFCETGRRMTAGGLTLVRVVGVAVGRMEGQGGERLTAAVARATAALQSFGQDLDRWRDAGSDRFALGEDGFNFRLHYEHVLRDTAPELWRYGHRLKDDIEADLAERAGAPGWQAVLAGSDRAPAGGPSQRDGARAVLREGHGAGAEVRGNPEDRAPSQCCRGGRRDPRIPAPHRAAYRLHEAPGTYSHRPQQAGSTLRRPSIPPSPPPNKSAYCATTACKWEVAPVTLNEGYPGHHLQIVHAQEQPSQIRKLILSPLTLEGWALYCEEADGRRRLLQR